MSHRVTTETEIRDKAVALEALALAKFSYQDLGETIRITSGPARGALLDLRTGTVTGDDEKHNKSDASLGVLKRFYAEAVYTRTSLEQGFSILGREVLSNGDIKLTCRQSFG